MERSLVGDWLARALDLLFPPRCVGCSKTGSWFCTDCLASVKPILPPFCSRCGRRTQGASVCASCRSTPVVLDGIRSVACHEGALREAIHHFKYHNRRELVEPLGQLLSDYWREADLAADLVIPVPLHKSRQEERGYNQSALLARALTRHAGLVLDGTDLVRTRATPPQVGLDAKERRANVHEAFAWTGGSLRGLVVLLIDDVCTTGATLQACAAAVRRGGAAGVWALTLARPWDGVSLTQDGNVV
jgi:ComF family protein